MGLFNVFKKNYNNEFRAWLDSILYNELDNNIRAIMFNLYEDEDDNWSVELVGTPFYDENNDDWACNELFTTRDNPFVIKSKEDYDKVEGIFKDLVKNYLNNGTYYMKLKNYDAIGIGFVEGDITILYQK